MKSSLLKIFLSAIGLLVGMNAASVSALTFSLPAPGNQIVGEVQYASARSGEALADVGRRYDIGYDEISEANIHLANRGVLAGGTRVVIPSQFILPAAPREGIIINLPELRLYYYPPGRNVVVTEPIGIGKEGWQTPVGVTKIVEKRKDPSWHPTDNVRAEAARQGYLIPEVFPPGPDNPLGRYAMRLGWRDYLIHGTNAPKIVGGRVSAGCIRMFNEDIERLYDMVPIGTRVQVVNEPFKVGWSRGNLYIEVHRPLVEQMSLYEEDVAPLVQRIIQATQNKHMVVHWRTAQQEAKSPTGIPRLVGG